MFCSFKHYLGETESNSLLLLLYFYKRNWLRFEKLKKKGSEQLSFLYHLAKKLKMNLLKYLLITQSKLLITSLQGLHDIKKTIDAIKSIFCEF